MTPSLPIPLRIACLAGVVGLTAAGSVQAGKVYRWTDADGVTHYGDHQPQAPTSPVTELATTNEVDAVARLRVENEAGRTLAWVDNRLAGPIEVSVTASGLAVPPARATVPAHGSALVSVLEAAPPGQSPHYELRVDRVVPGDPRARPADVEYRLPLDMPELDIQQGFGGAFSHGDRENRHAIDFGAPIGTPVLAARDGVVMRTEGGFDQAGLDPDEYLERANFIRILHDDGSMALYAHLAEGGVHVRVGQRVQAGQRIGLSGNTGYTTGPHLHFVVQANRGMRLESLPIRLRGPGGVVQFALPR